MKKIILPAVLSSLLISSVTLASVPASMEIQINNGLSPTQKDLRTTTVAYSILLPSDATVVQGSLYGTLQPHQSATVEIQSKDPNATALGTIVQLIQDDKVSHTPEVLWTTKLNYDATSNQGSHIILQNNTNFNNWAGVTFVADLATINVTGML